MTRRDLTSFLPHSCRASIDTGPLPGACILQHTSYSRLRFVDSSTLRSIGRVVITGQDTRRAASGGDLLMTPGTRGTAGDNASRDPFNRPNAAAIDSNGDIYVSDGYVNSRIVHFTPEGEFVRIVGGGSARARASSPFPASSSSQITVQGNRGAGECCQLREIRIM
jgi:NHL repeat